MTRPDCAPRAAAAHLRGPGGGGQQHCVDAWRSDNLRVVLGRCQHAHLVCRMRRRPFATYRAQAVANRSLPGRASSRAGKAVRRSSRVAARSAAESPACRGRQVGRCAAMVLPHIRSMVSDAPPSSPPHSSRSQSPINIATTRAPAPVRPRVRTLDAYFSTAPASEGD